MKSPNLNPKLLKEIKNSMLTSGVPLEVSVAARLVELKWIVLENLPVLLSSREPGEPPIKSEGDVLARKTCKGDTGVIVDLAIECEYRNPSITWIFFNSQKYSSSLPSVYESYVTTFKKRITPKVQAQSAGYEDELITPLFKGLRPQSKGLQVPGETGKAFSKELVLKSVEQAVEAALNWKRENIPELLDSGEDGLTTSMIIPMVVTTARLWEFKGTTLTSVSKVSSDNLEKYFKEVDYLIFDYQLPHKLRFEDGVFGESEFIFVPIINYYNFKEFVRKLEGRMKLTTKT